MRIPSALPGGHSRERRKKIACGVIHRRQWGDFSGKQEAYDEKLPFGRFLWL